MAILSVLGGYGAVGTRLCRLLARAGHHLRIAGRTPARAQALAREIGPQACACPTDATDNESLDALCTGADMLLNCAGPYRIIRDIPARAALRHGLPYMDAAGDEYLMGILEPDREAFAAAGQPVLLSCGTYPGLSGLFPRAMAARLFDSVDSFSLYTDFSHSTVTYTAAFDIVSTLQKDTGSGMNYWLDGELRRDDRGLQTRRMPGCGEMRVMYPCFSEEMRRLATELQAYEGHAYLALDEKTLGGLFAACAPGQSEEQQQQAARQLLETFDTDRPETLFHLDMEGERDGLPAAYAATLRAPVGSLQYVSDVMAAAVEVVLAGRFTAGAHYLAGGVDADALLKILEGDLLAVTLASPGL